MARDIMRQNALKPFVLAERLPGSEKVSDEDLIAFGCAHGKTDHHPVGTCRMGHGADAVVTPDLKLRGIGGLRVCDASVMPQLISSNTNAAAIMIGEKAADLIRGRAPLPPIALPGQGLA
jgi:choline dehydrogenase-like flavoprotein